MPIDATSTAEEIAEIRQRHVADLAEAEASELRQFGSIAGRLYSPDWRKLIEFDFSQCRHTQATLVEVEAHRWDEGRGETLKVGTWGMEICTSCGAQVRKECPHEMMEWQFDGRLLVCLNCGINGT